ncbi:hypothetical protein SASPL_120823 [Salvia splendens]|uniref:Uncharacterized protein n=1 Tax=Salvia splendens TaxID=180675 RepID=A0A8X8ZWL9_SALSN|nr:hypothetical protein SASPL_120823 [Salvia splendens]
MNRDGVRNKVMRASTISTWIVMHCRLVQRDQRGAYPLNKGSRSRSTSPASGEGLATWPAAPGAVEDDDVVEAHDLEGDEDALFGLGEVAEDELDCDCECGGALRLCGVDEAEEVAAVVAIGAGEDADEEGEGWRRSLDFGGGVGGVFDAGNDEKHEDYDRRYGECVVD